MWERSIGMWKGDGELDMMDRSEESQLLNLNLVLFCAVLEILELRGKERTFKLR